MPTNFSIEHIVRRADETLASWEAGGAVSVARTLPDGGLAACIDHTILKADATPDEVLRICGEAREASFASVCVNPVYVPLCAQALSGARPVVCTVIGFPLGASAAPIKAAEVRRAASDGAAEFDMVLPVGLLLAGQWQAVLDDIRSVVDAAREARADALVKVILETCYLTPRALSIACLLAEAGGADFVKTSTGFGPAGATPEAVRFMAFAVGGRLRVKASGGIRTREAALQYLSLGADRIGTSSGLSMLAH